MTLTDDFDPSQNFGLAALKEAWPHRDADDRVGRIFHNFDINGAATFRPLRLEDALDAVEEEAG